MPSRTKAVIRSRRNQKKTRVFTVVYQPVPVNEGAGYYAHIPALEITTEGETLDEAKEMARDAIECYVETARAISRPIPQEVTSETMEVAV